MNLEPTKCNYIREDFKILILVWKGQIPVALLSAMALSKRDSNLCFSTNSGSHVSLLHLGVLSIPSTAMFVLTPENRAVRHLIIYIIGL